MRRAGGNFVDDVDAGSGAIDRHSQAHVERFDLALDVLDRGCTGKINIRRPPMFEMRMLPRARDPGE